MQFHDPVMDLPTPYYAAIGEFLFRFAQLEYQMHEVVWMALDLGYKSGRILTIGTDVKVLCGMINTIASAKLWVKNPTRIQEMNSIANNARKLAPLVAHGSWQEPDGDSKRAQLHFLKEATERILPRFDTKLDDAALHRRAGQLRALNLRAKKLISLLDVERPSSQNRSS